MIYRSRVGAGGPNRVVAREVTLLPPASGMLGTQPAAPRWRCESSSRRPRPRQVTPIAAGRQGTRLSFIVRLAGNLAALEEASRRVVRGRRRRSGAHCRLASDVPRPHRQARLSAIAVEPPKLERARLEAQGLKGTRRDRPPPGPLKPPAPAHGNVCRRIDSSRRSTRKIRVHSPPWKAFSRLPRADDAEHILQPLFAPLTTFYLGQMIGVDALASVSVVFP